MGEPGGVLLGRLVDTLLWTRRRRGCRGNPEIILALKAFSNRGDGGQGQEILSAGVQKKLCRHWGGLESFKDSRGGVEKTACLSTDYFLKFAALTKRAEILKKLLGPS